ncbi:hypothetical protein BH23THE1_BH23THE1_17630 [soil metagenome]
MQGIKKISNKYEFSQTNFLIITLSIVLLSSTFTLNTWLDAFAQQQQQNTGSLVNSICQLVQDNGLISGLVGLDQALNICNNLNAIGSNQALAQLCSTIGGLNVINVDAFCSQQTSSQTQSLNQNNQRANSQDSTESNQGNTENTASNSIIDRILGLLFGFLNF